MENQLQGLQSHITQAVDEYKATYPAEMKFDYSFKANETPFNVLPSSPDLAGPLIHPSHGLLNLKRLLKDSVYL